MPTYQALGRTWFHHVWRFVESNIASSGKEPKRVLAGFFAGWICLLVIGIPPRLLPGLSHEGQDVLAILVWASLMWISEALPVGITGISIPLLLIATHAIPWTRHDGAAQPPLAAALSGFTTDVVWLCLFAFICGSFMQSVGLDRRIAISLLYRMRASSVGRVVWVMFAVNLVLTFLLPAANARAAALFPAVNGILGLLGQAPQERGAQKAIVILSLVYASMITGLFVLTGHLPNMILAGLLARNGHSISYLRWMLLNCPYLGLFVLAQYWVRHAFHSRHVTLAGGVQHLSALNRDLGPMKVQERVLLGIFVIVGAAFALGAGSPIYQLHELPLGVVGLAGILLLFTPGLIPITWKQIESQTPWGTFLLLGGALTLTGAMMSSGLAAWLADAVHRLVGNLNIWVALLLVMVGTHVIRLGMLSNVASVAMSAPVLYKLAPSLGMDSAALTLLVCNSDSLAFILPTQITAGVIAYSTGSFSLRDYARVGLVTTILAIVFTIVVMVPWYEFWGLPLRAHLQH